MGAPFLAQSGRWGYYNTVLRKIQVIHIKIFGNGKAKQKAYNA
jgi:hypothetical protein